MPVSRLQLNHTMNIGDQLVSPDGRAAMILQTDGNLVLYRTDNRQALWSSKTNGRGVVRANLQSDGNLVLVDRNDAPLWASNTRGTLPGVNLSVQNDGNAVLEGAVYLPTGGAWSTESSGFKMKPEGGFFADLTDAIGDAGAWVANAAKSAGKAIGTVAEAITSAAGEIGHLLSEIPIIGPGLAGFYDWTYGAAFAFGDALLKGERIDKAIVDSYKSQLNDLHEMAPYIQTAISFIPAVGPGVAGAISAGFALADGKTIDAALLEGVKGSLPGGALAEMAFDAGTAALQGKPVGDVFLAAAPIPDEAKRAVKAGMNIASDLAAGKPADEALLNEAYNQLPDEGKRAVDIARSVANGKNVAAVLIDQTASLMPPEARQALNAGMAMGHATNLQEIAGKTLTSPEFLGQMASLGNAAGVSDAVVSNARSLVPAGAQNAFDIGAGMMKHSVSQHEFTTVRNALSDAEKGGFDMAAALQIGRVSSPPPAPPNPPPPPSINPLPEAVDKAVVDAVNGAATGKDSATGRTIFSGGVAPSYALAIVQKTYPKATLSDVYRSLYKNVNFVSPDKFNRAPLTENELTNYLVSMLLDDGLTIQKIAKAVTSEPVGYYFGGRMGALTQDAIVARLKNRSALLKAGQSTFHGAPALFLNVTAKNATVAADALRLRQAKAIDDAIARDIVILNINLSRAGFAMTKGLQGAPIPSKVGAMKAIAAVPSARAGAADGLLAITAARVAAAEKYKSLWDYVRQIFGHPMIDHHAPASTQLAQANKILGIA